MTKPGSLVLDKLNETFYKNHMVDIPITPQDASFNSLDCKKLDLFLGKKPEQY